MSKRDSDLIEYLQGRGPVEAQALAAHLGVSDRTVRARVQSANNAMDGCARVCFGDNRYSLHVQNEPSFRSWLRATKAVSWDCCPETSDERVVFLLNDLLLRNEWITIGELSDILFVSRVSISSDLKAVEKKLAEYGLTLVRRARRGIRVEGPEVQRRACLASVVAGSAAPGLAEETDREVIDAICACIDEALADSNVRISSIAYHSLAVHLAIALLRVRNDCYVPMDTAQLDRLAHSDEYASAQRLATILGARFGVELPDEEVAYLAIHLAGKRDLGDLSASLCEQETSPLVIGEDVWGVVSHMIDLVWRSYRFDFREDLELRMNLARHVIPLSVRLRNGLRIDNPLISEIRSRYPLALAMATECAPALAESYGAVPSEDEIGYIALAFELALERQRTELPKKNILIVCATGHGSARMLEHRYRQEFGPYLGNVITCDPSEVKDVEFTDIDYAFTTVPLDVEIPVPLRAVEFFLDDAELREMREFLGHDGQGNEPISLFSRDLFLSHLGCSSQGEAIDALCSLACDRREVDERLRDLVIAREKLMTTAFGNRVAVPHPIEPLVEKTLFAVATLDRPIDWNGQPVQVVFLMVIGREAVGELDRFFEALTAMLVDKHDIDSLLADQSFDNLSRLLSSHDPVPPTAH